MRLVNHSELKEKRSINNHRAGAGLGDWGNSIQNICKNIQSPRDSPLQSQACTHRYQSTAKSQESGVLVLQTCWKCLNFEKNERITWAHPTEKASHVPTGSPLPAPELSHAKREFKTKALRFWRLESLNQELTKGADKYQTWP